MMIRYTNRSMVARWVAPSALWWRTCAWKRSKKWPLTRLKYNLKYGNATWMIASASSKEMLLTLFIVHLILSIHTSHSLLKRNPDQQIAFLDTLVSRKDNTITIDVYRKATHTDRYLRLFFSPRQTPQDQHS